MRLRYFAIALILAAVGQAQPPDTTVSGNVAGVWGPPYTEYYVAGNLTVPSGQHLTILAGVEVIFQGNYGITVEGGLVAHGTATDSIYFRHSAAGDWKYIDFQSTILPDDSAKLIYCRLEEGERAVKASGNKVTVEHCLIRDFSSSPIYAVDVAQTSLIQACTITDNNGSGINLLNASANIYNCTITNCGGTGHGITASGAGTIQVNGGYIANNDGAGIKAQNLLASSIQNVEIAFNHLKGIEYTSCGQLVLACVLLHHNEDHGLFMSLTSVEGRNLTISQNQGAGVFFSGSNKFMNISSSIVDHNEQWGFYKSAGLDNLIYNDAYQNSYSVDSLNYLGCTAGAYSISLDPLYTDTLSYLYTLQSLSPCIDTGSPSDPQDPDGTQTDMGRFYYNQNPVAILAVSTTSLAFPPTLVNTSSQLPIKLYNVGTIDLILDQVATLTPAFANNYALADSLILSGDSLLLSVSFAPDSAGNFTDTLAISSNGGAVNVDLSGTGTGMGILDPYPVSQNPVAYRMITAFPNPFNPVLKIQIQPPQPGFGRLQVWSVDGRLVADLWQGWLTKGTQEILWPAQDKPSGLYFLRFETGHQVEHYPCILVK